MHVIFSAASHLQCHGLYGRKFEVREFFVILNKALAVDIRRSYQVIVRKASFGFL